MRSNSSVNAVKELKNDKNDVKTKILDDGPSGYDHTCNIIII